MVEQSSDLLRVAYFVVLGAVDWVNPALVIVAEKSAKDLVFLVKILIVGKINVLLVVEIDWPIH